jgi:hypothetical protein
MLSALFEKFILLLSYASDLDCENAFELISNCVRRAEEEKYRQLARPGTDQGSLQSLLVENSDGDNASLHNKKR